MKDLKTIICSAVLILGAFAIVLTGCGGGSGRGTAGTTEASLTTANAPVAASAVLQTANVVGASTALGELQTSSISSRTSLGIYSKLSLKSILDKIVSISKTQRHKSEVQIAGNMPPTTESCSGGGSVTVSAYWIGPDNPTDASQIVNFQGNMTFNSCKEETETMNGSMSVVFEGPLSAPSKLTVSTSGFTYADTATGDAITMTNLNMVITGLTFSGDEFTGGTIVLTGAVTGTADGYPIDVECDNYKIVFSSGVSGETVSVSGRMKASCLGGWVTATTNTPIFVPAGADCPTAGEIVVTAGGNNVKAVITSDSRITIYYNDTLVQTYDSCEDVDGLCIG